MGGAIMFWPPVRVEVYTAKSVNGTSAHLSAASMGLGLPFLGLSCLAVVFSTLTSGFMERGVLHQDNHYTFELLPELGPWDVVFWLFCGLALVLSNEPKLYIMNLNNTENRFDDPFPVTGSDDILCVQAFLADDKSAWGKQVCILDHFNICFYFQRGVEMIPFRRITNFQLHHSLLSPVQTIRVTSKEGNLKHQQVCKKAEEHHDEQAKAKSSTDIQQDLHS